MFVGTSHISFAGIVSCIMLIIMALRLGTIAHTLYYLYEVAAALFMNVYLCKKDSP